MYSSNTSLNRRRNILHAFSVERFLISSGGRLSNLTSSYTLYRQMPWNGARIEAAHVCNLLVESGTLSGAMVCFFQVHCLSQFFDFGSKIHKCNKSTRHVLLSQLFICTSFFSFNLVTQSSFKTVVYYFVNESQMDEYLPQRMASKLVWHFGLHQFLRKVSGSYAADKCCASYSLTVSICCFGLAR